MMRDQEAIKPFSTPEPRISIITASRDESSLLERHIESILSQGYSNFEHILVDALSSDETKEILRKHPHILWSSGEYASLAEQYNEGMKRATGEILCWITASDYFLPEVFSSVVEQLQKASLVLCGCQVVDESGQEQEVIGNGNRHLHDVLKYWVHHSSYDLSGLFFRKTLLEDLLTSGRLFSEEYPHAMEYALSLCLERRKTQENWKYVEKTSIGRQKKTEDESLRSRKRYREASRLFRRFGIASAQAERKISVVIPTECGGDAFERTLQSCSRQSLADLEIVTWGTGDDAKQRSELCRFVDDVAGMSSDGRYKVDCSFDTKSSFLTNLGECIERTVRAPLLMLLLPGDELAEHALLKISNSFEQDSLGALIPCGGNPEMAHCLIVEKEGTELFNVQALFQPVMLPRSGAFRTIALQEILQCRFSEEQALAMRELYLLFQYKAWSVQVVRDGVVLPAAVTAAEESLSPELLQAKLINRLATVREADIFADERSKSGAIIEFPDETVQAARAYLQSHHS